MERAGFFPAKRSTYRHREKNKKRTCVREQIMHKCSDAAAVAVWPLTVQKEEQS
jgi:hypothetical protein